MKKILIFAAVAAIGMTACSNDKTIETRGDDSTLMGFRTVTEKGQQTRATVTNGSNILGFTVTGWWDKDGNNTYGSADANVGSYLFNAFDITRGEGTANWDYNPKRYWPTAGDVDFFAYSPNSSVHVTSGLADFDGTELAYKIPAANDDKMAQEDFLVAALLNKTGTPDPTITLNFQHALSRVLFQAKKTNPDITYIVNGIELVNLSSEASLDLTTGIPATGGFDYTIGTGPVVLWDSHGAKDDVTVDLSDSPVYVMDIYTPVIGKTNALMVMPQTTILGETYDAASAPSFEKIDTPKNATWKADGEFYIKVSYKAFQGHGKDIIYYAGSATEYKEMYLPVEDPFRVDDPFTFEIGRQYTFMLTFGSEVGGDPIGFNVAVQNWDEYAEVFPPKTVDVRDFMSTELAALVDNATYDTDLDSKVSYTEIGACTTFTINNTVTSFTGLSYFWALADLTVETDDAALTTLNVASNKQLTKITFGADSAVTRVVVWYGYAVGDIAITNSSTVAAKIEVVDPSGKVIDTI